MAKQQKSKNQLRREKAKLKKINQDSLSEQGTSTPPTSVDKKESNQADVTQAKEAAHNDIKDESAGIAVSSAPSSGKIFESDMDKLLSMPEFSQFKQVFDRFHTEDAITTEDPKKGDIMSDDDAPLESDSETETKTNTTDQPKMSKKKLRKANKMPLSELKAIASNPELVQWYDVDAADPVLLVQIKSRKNHIEVPPHWQYKRDYLSSKRGFEKKAFELPRFISETGITDMRDTTQEDDATLKQRQRERVQPKMNRLDMDYQKLHDAFFKFQTKPKLSKFGDVYYEGKENEKFDYSVFKPGVVSLELRSALGIPDGVAMPWIQKMHQLGTPPSYPDMKFPGFNAPVELQDGATIELDHGDEVERELFGTLLVVDESESEEEEDEEDGQDSGEDEDEPQYVDEEEIGRNHEDANGDDAVVMEDEVQVVEEPSDEEDVPLAEVELASRDKDDEQVDPKKLYQIIKENVKAGSGLMSSGRSYEIPSAGAKRKSSGGEQQLSKKAKTETSKQEEEEDDDGGEDDEGEKFKF